MGSSAPVPPDEGDAPKEDAVDETEMTSIMSVEQRRELQQAARTAKEPERETARPPPEAAVIVEGEIVVIPRAAAIPAEALRTPAPVPAVSPASSPSREPSSSATWFVVAFVLLAAAIAFEMR
jgi:hypothetical protein